MFREIPRIFESLVLLIPVPQFARHDGDLGLSRSPEHREDRRSPDLILREDPVEIVHRPDRPAVHREDVVPGGEARVLRRTPVLHRDHEDRGLPVITRPYAG
jgi:hypothetical protein